VSYVPAEMVRVKHSDGDLSVVNVMPKQVVVYNRSGQYVQQFSGGEIASLRRVTGLSND
jgi:hypothetical protein